MITTPDPARDVDILVVFIRPRDFPRHVVVRKQWIAPGVIIVEPFACLYDTFAEAQFECEATGRIWRERDPRDEPQIAGIWV